MKHSLFLITIVLLYGGPAISQQGTNNHAKSNPNTIVKKEVYIIIKGVYEATLSDEDAPPPIPQPTANGLARDNLYGKVKSVKYYVIKHEYDTPGIDKSYEYNADGNETGHKCYFDDKEPPIQVYQNKYGTNGKIAEIIGYSDKYGIPVVEKYAYDDHGNEIEYNVHHVKDSILDSRTVTNYDTLHHKVSSYTTGPWGDTSSIDLYEHGNKVKSLSYRLRRHNIPLEYIIETRDYKYDEQGHMTSEEYHTNNNSEHPGYYEYTYDEKGRKVREEIGNIKKDSLGLEVKYRTLLITTYTYDKYGNITSIKNDGYEGITMYEYDKHGNWIREYSQNEGRFTRQREIEYYP